MKYARKSRWALLFKFHRYSGLLAAVVILMLSTTGLFLNHTEDFKLDERFVDSGLLLDWYGIKAVDLNRGFPVSGHWITQIDKRIFFDASPLLHTADQLLGAVGTPEFFVIALSNQLLLITHDGEIIEQIDKSDVQKIASNKTGTIFLQHNGNISLSNDALLSWQDGALDNAEWARQAELPDALRNALKQQSRHNILPYERVMLDLHSGRIFGKAGVYFIDFSAILLILITLSGCWIWLRHKLKSHRAKRLR